ncbi:MAG: hypothetical protein EOP11_06940 [Proteobacteria bacterium]|nr:MAG: hypothetical protein EOP11_06940 [Pseudomonadota bacterium]
MIGIGGDDEENQDLIAALEAEANAEEQHAFVIGAGDMQAPEDLLNATAEPLPESFLEGQGAADFGGLDNFPSGEEGTSSDDPFALKEVFADEALGEGLAAATDEGLAGEFGASPEADGFTGDGLDLGVDEMLAAALPEGELDLGGLDLSLTTGELPTFSLQIETDDPHLRPRLKEIAVALGINLSASAWENRAPLLSQLTEYQAVLFQKEARTLGAHVRPVVSFPVPQPSEEDLAGFLIQETRGPVSAHRRIARRMFRDEEIAGKMQRELSRASGRSAAPADSHLQLLFREIFLELQSQALKLGANAVLSLRVESFRETAALDPSSAELRLLVIGTAAVVETA